MIEGIRTDDAPFLADCPRFPARTAVVTHLVREGVRVEVDGVAALAR
ncbi:hypothetical protein [Streptomyces puniciscabiei]